MLLLLLRCLNRRTILSQLMGDQSAVVGPYAGHSVGPIAAIGVNLFLHNFNMFIVQMVVIEMIAFQKVFFLWQKATLLSNFVAFIMFFSAFCLY